MQLHYLHFNKCAGTSIQHFLRTRIAEPQFLACEQLPSLHVRTSDCFDRALLHDPYGYDLSDLPWRPIEFAIFRDPLERSYSDFEMVCRWRPEEINDERTHRLATAAATGIDRLVTNSDPLVASTFFNSMTMSLVGRSTALDWLREANASYPDLLDAPTEQLLEIALQHVEDIDIALAVDDLSSIGLLAAALARHSLPLHNDMVVNRYNSSHRFNGLSNAAIAGLRRWNELDLRVWARVRKLMQDRPAARVIERLKRENDSLFLDFRHGIPAQNIWPREVNLPKYSIWTGNGGHTTFFLPFENTIDKFLNIHVTNVIEQRQLDDLVIRVNGHKVAWTRQDASVGVLLTARIGEALLHGCDHLRVELATEALRPPCLHDERRLGLELSGLSLITQWTA